MKKYLDFVSIFIDKMILFVSDGFVVMVGKKNGVIVYFKRDNDSVIYFYCQNYWLKVFNLIIIMSNIDELLISFFKYYYYSIVCFESFNVIQNLLREIGEFECKNNLIVKKVVYICWFSYEVVV